jgi:hypothetical protein
MDVPHGKFKSSSDRKDYLKPGISSEILNRLAHLISNIQAMQLLLKVCWRYFKTIHGRVLKTG